MRRDNYSYSFTNKCGADVSYKFKVADAENKDRNSNYVCIYELFIYSNVLLTTPIGEITYNYVALDEQDVNFAISEIVKKLKGSKGRFMITDYYSEFSRIARTYQLIEYLEKHHSDNVVVINSMSSEFSRKKFKICIADFRERGVINEEGSK